MTIRAILLLVLFGTTSHAELEVVEGPGLCSLKWDDKSVVVEKSEMQNMKFKPIGSAEGGGSFKDYAVILDKVYYYRLRSNDGALKEKSCVPAK